MAEPIQLPLFPDHATLARIRPEANEWRFYRLAICPPPAIPPASPAEPSPAPPNLFGRALLARHWGRIGTQGRIRLDPHPDSGAALNALATLARQKRRRGYQDRAA